eukprot:gene9896-1784_t
MTFRMYQLPFCRPAEGVNSELENLGEILWGERIQNSPFNISMKVEEACHVLCVFPARPQGVRNLIKRIEQGYRSHLIVDNLPVLTQDIPPKLGCVAFRLPLCCRVCHESMSPTVPSARGMAVCGPWLLSVLSLRPGAHRYPLGLSSKQVQGTDNTVLYNHLDFNRRLGRFQHSPAVQSVCPFPALFRSVDVPMHLFKAPVLVSARPARTAPGPRCASASELFTHGAGCRRKGDWVASDESKPTFQLQRPSIMDVDDTKITEIPWTYSVKFTEDPDTTWRTRWDSIMKTGGSTAIHTMAIFNSLLVVVVLSAATAIILIRTLHYDFNRYNDPDNQDEHREETGWKLCHKDVFRRPEKAALLSVMVGTGVQLVLMLFLTLIFALIGALSPARRSDSLMIVVDAFAQVVHHRVSAVPVLLLPSDLPSCSGMLLLTLLLLYMSLSGFAGLVTAILGKMWVVQAWKNVLWAAVVFPGSMLILFTFMQLVMWFQNAANAVPLYILGVVYVLWLLCIPLTFLGALGGVKLPVILPPCTPSEIPTRPIPERRTLLRYPYSMLLGGIVPFGAALFEVNYGLSAFWQHQFPYSFVFVAVVFIIIIVTTVDIILVIVYFQLCYEDYEIWWGSFCIGGAPAIYLFLYSVYYFF